MAYCDECGNFNDANLTDVAYENPLDIKNYQPDLYYYWDVDFCTEDYNWRDAFPHVDCMCEICFDIADSKGKIEWTNKTDPFFLPQVDS